MGIAESRNIGVKNAKGKLVFFTDSDCMPMLNWLEQGVKAISDYDIVTGWTLYENPHPSFKDRIVEGKDDFFTCNLGFKKSAITGVNGFDEDFSMYMEDKDLCYRILENGGKKVFSENMVVIHQKLLRKPMDELKIYKNYYKGKLLNEIRHKKNGEIVLRVIKPSDLIIVLFPPILLLFRPFKNLNDIILLPFTWLGMIIGRISMWKECFKQKRFYI